MRDALQAYQDDKKFEEYLTIERKIKESGNRFAALLLTELKDAFQKGQELMYILKELNPKTIQ